MDVRTKSIRLLTIGLAAAAMAAASMAARATLIASDPIQGCMLAGYTGTDAGAMRTACGTTGATGNLLTAAPTQTIGATGTDFNFSNATWQVSLDFGADGATELKITNISKQSKPAVQNVHLLFFDLDFVGGETFAGQPFTVTDFTSSVRGDLGTDNVGALLNATWVDSEGNAHLVQTGTDADGSQWYHIALDNAATFAAGETITLRATMNTVPEPGSVALLGIVLLAVGLASIKRVRRVSTRGVCRVAA